MKAVTLQQSERALRRKHAKFLRLVETLGPLEYTVPRWKNISDAIVYVVIGQMLSNAASNSIIKQLRSEVGSSTKILSWATSSCGCIGPVYGVSQRKRMALAAWKSHVEQNGRVWKSWQDMSLVRLRKEVTEIWGLGRWSADMLAIFFLGRLDVWPESDTGLKRASRLLFNESSMSKMGSMVKGCETVSALYLWLYLDKSPIDKLAVQNG